MTPAYLLPPLAGQYAALLRGVAAAPDDDTPRLVLADWLEEHDAPERAEFIRVQCEIGRLPLDWRTLKRSQGETKESRWERRTALAVRERELLRDRMELLLPEIAGLSRMATVRDLDTGETSHAGWTDTTGVGGVFVTADFRRGFVDTVRGPLAAMLGEPCGRCDGGGVRVGADRPFDWTPDPDRLKCPICNGIGRTPGALERMGPELLVARRAEPTDVEPFMRGDYRWFDTQDFPAHRGGNLPTDLFAVMWETNPNDQGWLFSGRRVLKFTTEADARDALSRAVLAVARRRAGLEVSHAS